MATIKQTVNSVLNYIFPTPDVLTGSQSPAKQEKKKARNLSATITPVQFQRIRVDVQSWREAILEAENAFYPHRVKMQRVLQDTALNGHVEACIKRRKNLSLMKDFCLKPEDGEPDEKATKLLNKKWFRDFLSYCLDANLYGYTLVSLGDMINDEFPNLTIIRRHNISPDRMNVTSYVYSLSGENFMDPQYKPWHIWVPTNTETGVSNCGYGLLYKVALYEIFCRNVLGYNGDAAQIFGMPLRVGKTSKTNESERRDLEQSLENMGSAGWVLLDMLDEITLVESKGSGAGIDIYDNLEKRCEAKISKILLGHADALDSTPGKLGATSGEENPAAKALADIQTDDCGMLENIVNNELLPRMRAVGIPIPESLMFCFKNDGEKEQLRQREDASNKTTAEIFQTIKNAGGKPDWKYFSDRTGIPVEEAPPEPAPGAPAEEEEDEKKPVKIKNRLNELYR